MKRFSIIFAIVIIAIVVVFSTGCPQSAKPEDDYSSDVATAKASLEITFAKGDSARSVTRDISLPDKVGDVSVKWTSSNRGIIATDGFVIRPAFVDGDAMVTLTATLSKGNASDTKDFNLTVLAVDPYIYTVQFDSQNADTVAYPSSITVTEPATTVGSLPTVPVKSGYEFDGWFTQPNGNGTEFTANTRVSGNITVYAKLRPVVYTITYNLNGGRNTVANPEGYTIESNTITLAEPEKDGFIFDGWYTDSSFNEKKTNEITKGSIGNKTYYAKWLKKCTVSYSTAYGTAPTSIFVGKGESLTAEQLPELTNSDYIFGGWYVSDIKVIAGNYSITDNITLTAKWSEKCTVNYVTEYGIKPTALDIAVDTKLTAANLPILTERCWRFLGWYSNSNYDEDKKVSAGETITENITLYAKWKFTGPNDGFIFVEGGTVFGDNSYNQYNTGAFPDGRTVTLSSFYICDHEVTQSEYETYCCYTEHTPYSPGAYGVGANYPVYFVSWYDAIVYCNLKSMAEGLTPCYSLFSETNPRNWSGIKSNNGKYSCSYTSRLASEKWDSIACDIKANGYRLPTEAEWEYAARGGQKSCGNRAFAKYFAGADTKDYSGGRNSDLDLVGWYYGNICGEKVVYIGAPGYGVHEVKKKSPNILGLYDMSGNVEEWCWDRYNKSVGIGIVSDPCGISSGDHRIRRGGSWEAPAYECSVSYRRSASPNNSFNYLGFRLVRSAQ